ncbi:MAG TPA: HI0074 family nucleotidyltransferase substrate-binding subunit [Candidatus Acidoferrum sp.]|nr:HI0074 family nucleotidyltransferase substrate-binding subunit [Candidatus Acidoferrum sp.]
MTLEEFSKAVARLDEAARQPKNDFMRDSVIQRYEFSIELAWKTAKRAMGVATAAPKDVVREMAQSGYIDDVAIWLQAVDMRNLSSHTYKEELAERVYAFACAFVPHLQALLARLEAK